MKLGTILRREGVLTEEQLEEALSYRAEKRVRLGEALLTLGMCTEAQLSRALAIQLQIPFVDLAQTPPDPAALRQVSSYVARLLRVVPVSVMDGLMLVVAQDPHDFTLDKRLRDIVRQPVQLAFASREQIENVLERYEFYATARADSAHRVLAHHRQEEYKRVQQLLRDDLVAGVNRVREVIKEVVTEGGRVEFILERAAVRVMVVTAVSKLTLAILPSHALKLDLDI
jgi:hypothetical protein